MLRSHGITVRGIVHLISSGFFFFLFYFFFLNYDFRLLYISAEKSSRKAKKGPAKKAATKDEALFDVSRHTDRQSETIQVCYHLVYSSSFNE